jgi:ABC-type polar amino acid transport system ATPase subunit
MTEEPMIVLDKVSKSYGPTVVLRDCTISIKRGEVVVICGPSGSGKSTLIKCINGLEPYQSGSIRVEGVEVGARTTNLPARRTRIGMVFQHFELDNIILAQVHALKRERDEAETRARKLPDRVGLSQRAHARPANLSGGQQQRVAIARALALDPKAMLFDEPTSALDPEMISEVLDVMVELAGEGMTMLVVTHEMGFARSVADRIVFMDRSEIVEDTPTDQFFSAPKSQRAQEFLFKVLAH